MLTSQYILEKYHLLKTLPRIEILDCFLHFAKPISDVDIKSSVNQKINRTTRYRTLQVLIEKGIIHKIITDGKEVKFALTDLVNKNSSEHCHFQCVKCGEVECMSYQSIPEIQLPENYLIQERSLIVTGLCPKCGKKV